MRSRAKVAVCSLVVLAAMSAALCVWAGSPQPQDAQTATQAKGPGAFRVEAPVPSITLPGEGQCASWGGKSDAAVHNASPPAVAAAPVKVEAANLDNTFTGVDFDTNPAYNGGYMFIPPDPIAAAGPTHVVSVVNALIEWRPKDGSAGTVQSLAGFFAPLSPVNFLFDPKVIYDQYEGRFLVVALEKRDTGGGDPVNSSRILVAVSQTDDPNAGWWYTAIDSLINIGGVDCWADYPGFAVDDQAVYITTNIFNFSGLSSAYGVRLWIIDKSPFYAGGAALVNIYNPYAGGGTEATTQPTHIYGTPPGSTGTFLVSYSGLNLAGTEYVQVVRVDNPLSSPTFSQQYVSLGDIENSSPDLPNAPQLGTAYLINTNDRRDLNAVWRDNALWTTFEVLPASGPDSGQVTAHWVKLDTTTLASLTVADQGDVGGEDIATGTYTFFPSIGVDACGNMAIGFAASAPSIYCGAYYTARKATDPAGTVQPSSTLHAGTDWYYRVFKGTRNRWGDYSGLALDPNGYTFWVFNEYAMTRGTITSGQDGRWATQYGSFRVLTAADCPTITLGDLPDGNVGNAYSASAAASPAGTYTYALTSGTLPPGLGLDTGTGAVTGTPTTPGSYAFTITAATTCGCLGSRAYTVTVCGQITFVPVVSPAPPIDTTPSWDGSNAVSPFGNPNTATYGQTITAPAGGATLTDFTFYMKVPSSCVFRGEVYAWDGTKATGAALWEGAPTTTNDTAFNPVTFNTGGVALTGGQQYVLFASVSKDPATGSGIWGFILADAYPGGDFVFMNNGYDPSQWTASTWDGFPGTDLAFKVDFVSSAAVPDATASLPYTFTITASGSTAPYSFALTGGALPAGLALSGGGTISGTPTVVGTFEFTVTATDAYGCTGQQDFVITVVCPTIDILPASLPSPVKNSAYSETLTATAGIAPFSFAVTGGALPAGLTLSPDGTISGTPTASGVFNFTVTVTDANGCTGSRSYNFVVFDLSFYDESGSSQACVLISTGYFQWNILTGPYAGTTYTGNLNVYNGGTMFWSQPGASQYVYLYYDPNNHTAWGYLYDYSLYIYTSLYDMNTLNNPGCGVAP